MQLRYVKQQRHVMSESDQDVIFRKVLYESRSSLVEIMTLRLVSIHPYHHKAVYTYRNNNAYNLLILAAFHDACGLLSMCLQHVYFADVSVPQMITSQVSSLMKQISETLVGHAEDALSSKEVSMK